MMKSNAIKEILVKKVTTVLLMVFMVVVMVFSSVGLSGCAKSASDGQPVTLTVYYVANTANYKQALDLYSNRDINLNCVTFDSDAKMADQLAAEMANGTGPDVVLFSSAATLDVYKSEKSGNFADLTKYIKEDTDYNSDKYFTNVVEGARVDGKQYIIPFYFNLDMYGVRKTVAEETDVKNLDNLKNYNAFVNALSTQLAQMKADDNKSIIPFNLKWDTDNISCYLRSVGLNLIDANGNRIISDEDFKTAMKVVKELYGLYGEDTKNLKANSPEMFMNEDSYLLYGNTMLTVSVMQSITKEQNDDLLFCGIPASSTASGYQASLSLYGVANSNSKHVDNCYKLLKYLMDYQDEKMSYLTVPVSKSSYTKAETYLKSGYCSYSLTNTKTILVPKWSDEQTQYFDDVVNEVSVVSPPNAGIEKIISESMSDYLKDSASFDDCYKKMTEKLSLYLKE